MKGLAKKLSPSFLEKHSILYRPISETQRAGGIGSSHGPLTGHGYPEGEQRIFQMESVMGKVSLKMVFCALFALVLSGCSMFELPSKSDFSTTWVSREGKTREQLAVDQKECSRDAMLASPPAFFGEGHGGGGDMKVFNSCMRAKGWVKE